MRKKTAELFRDIQSRICGALEVCDGQSTFQSDLWERKDLDGSSYGGGGDTRILRGGAVFEQAGVNFSEVHGHLPAEMSEKLINRGEKAAFFAAGVSLVIHPFSPMVPTVHANFRYLEVEEFSWFGGGADLTPYCFFEEDAVHFHSVLKKACDRHNPDYYPEFKKWCDRYFFLPHRGETRGVGGIFFDYLGRDLAPGAAAEREALFAFTGDLGRSFNDAYVPIAERRKSLPFSDEQKSFQLLRRGRYVEFNLLYDRGTQFGLKTGGRTESILMSLPPNVRWEYNARPAEGSPEAALTDILKKPREWV